MKLTAVRANSIRFTCYVRGTGAEFVLLMHGFPDDAAGMLPLMEALDPERYTLVAPYMRGFAPTSRAPDRRYGPPELAGDVVGLLDAFGAERGIVFGHGLGAVAAWSAAVARPERVRGIVTAGCPPPASWLRAPRSPEQLVRLLPLVMLSVPRLSSWAITREEFEIVETLWRLWSPEWRWRPGRLAKVKHPLARRSTAPHVTRYFRALLSDALLDPARWRQNVALAMKPCPTPALVLRGAQDGLVDPHAWKHLGRHVLHSSRRVLTLDPCGHFPHQERTQDVAEAIGSFPWG